MKNFNLKLLILVGLVGSPIFVSPVHANAVEEIDAKVVDLTNMTLQSIEKLFKDAITINKQIFNSKTNAKQIQKLIAQFNSEVFCRFQSLHNQMDQFGNKHHPIVRQLYAIMIQFHNFISDYNIALAKKDIFEIIDVAERFLTKNYESIQQHIMLPQIGLKDLLKQLADQEPYEKLKMFTRDIYALGSELDKETEGAGSLAKHLWDNFIPHKKGLAQLSVAKKLLEQSKRLKNIKIQPIVIE